MYGWVAPCNPPPPPFRMPRLAASVRCGSWAARNRSGVRFVLVCARTCSATDLDIPDGATTSTILRVGFRQAMSSPSLITCGTGAGAEVGAGLAMAARMFVSVSVFGSHKKC